MKRRGQSGEIEEKDCPYGFIALDAWADSFELR